jgi:serine/threonine-protein kinase
MLERIGRYEILDRIASGGQGTVYRARDTVLDRVVAVKVINQNIEDDPAYLEALQREARLAARLDHPNITRVHDFQVENGIPYIVMEFVPDALDRELRGNERLPWRRAVEIGLQTARALQHAHDQGVVHRDIKPQNILLRETGAAALSDFGIARAFASSTKSQSGGVMGTPAYMAPEQWAGGAVDGRLDQYGLGIVLYEIIAGRPPFQGDSMEALYVQHRETLMPPMPSSLQVPTEVESVIRKTLEKPPDGRYGSASELAHALEGALTAGAIQRPETVVSSTPGRQSGRPEPLVTPRPPQPPAQPGQPAGSRSVSGHAGGISKWILFGGLASIIAAVIVVVGALTFWIERDAPDAVQDAVPANTPSPIMPPVLRGTPSPTNMTRANANGDPVLLGTLGSRGTATGQFIFPTDIAVASDGSVYVSDSGNHRIQKFDSEGIFINSWGTRGSDDGQFISPDGISLGADGVLYVADRRNDRVQKFTSNGVFISKWDSKRFIHEITKDSGAIVRSVEIILKSPLGIAVAPDGTVYVSCGIGSEIQRFTSDGIFIESMGHSATYGLGVAPDGTLYSASPSDNKIYMRAPGGDYIGSLGTGLQQPRDVSVAADGAVYVSDSANHRVLKFTDNSFAFKANATWKGTGEDALYYPRGIAARQDGIVYVADTSNDRIQKLWFGP